MSKKNKYTPSDTDNEPILEVIEEIAEEENVYDEKGTDTHLDFVARKLRAINELSDEGKVNALASRVLNKK